MGIKKDEKIIKLSYDLSIKGPFPPGSTPLSIKQIMFTEKGDIANAFQLNLTNHSGSHVDAPMHLNEKLKSITDYNIEEFIFNSPLIIDLKLGDDELIRKKSLKPYNDEISHCDILLIRTNFSRFRTENPDYYKAHGPGFSVEGARYLGKFSGLRAVGMDTISFAAITAIEEGIEAHKVFFHSPGNHFFIIEDINLNYDLKNLKQVILIPWLIKDIDSAPCSLLAIVKR